MPPILPDDWVSTVLGEVDTLRPYAAADLNSISGLPAPPFFLQLIVTNKDAFDFWAGEVRWSFGPAVRLEELQETKRIMVSVIYADSSSNVKMSFPPGDSSSIPPNLLWSGSSFSYDLEWTESLGSNGATTHTVEITGTVDALAEWMEFANCRYTTNTHSGETVIILENSAVLGPIRLSNCDMIPPPLGSKKAHYEINQQPDAGMCVQQLRKFFSRTENGVEEVEETLLTEDDDTTVLSVHVAFL